MFIFFASPKKTNQKKRPFFRGIFWLKPKTRFIFLNFAPQNIEAKNKSYTAEKDYKKIIATPPEVTQSKNNYTM